MQPSRSRTPFFSARPRPPVVPGRNFLERQAPPQGPPIKPLARPSTPNVLVRPLRPVGSAFAPSSASAALRTLVAEQAGGSRLKYQPLPHRPRCPARPPRAAHRRNHLVGVGMITQLSDFGAWLLPPSARSCAPLAEPVDQRLLPRRSLADSTRVPISSSAQWVPLDALADRQQLPVSRLHGRNNSTAIYEGTHATRPKTRKRATISRT